ncbi:MAG: hypothetical protein JWR59_2399 [Brevundimonas sp.]|nr:hypothetical protein [Brevundimonas sp.]
MIKAAAAFSLGLCLTSATAASAQSSTARDPVNRADLQCMSIMAAGVGMMEDGSKEQLGLVAGMSYYLGRLEGRAPSVNWLDELGSYLAGDFQDEVKTQSERCGAEMIAFGARMTSWGERIQELAAKQEPTKPVRP